MIIERAIDQFVPGPEGVAGCHDLGRVLLSIDAPIPSRRTIRFDVANQASRGVHSSQCRGRAWARKYRQFRAVAAGGAGLAQGAGNSSAFGRAHWHPANARIGDGAKSMRELGQNGSRVDTLPAGQVDEMKLAIRYSPFAI